MMAPVVDRLTVSEPFPPRAQLFLASVLLLLASGLGFLVAAGANKGFLREGEPFLYFLGQLKGVGLGGVAMVFAIFVPSRFWLRMAVPFGVLTLVLLAAVLVPGVGVERNGALRWLQVPFVRFQPSELAKLAIPLLIGWSLFRFGDEPFADGGAHRHLFYRVAQLGVLFAAVVLVAVEPDYGTALFLAAVGTTLLLLSGMPMRFPLLACLPLAPAVMWLFQTRRGVITNRLAGFFEPMTVPQVRESVQGIATGGWSGKGIGLGIESHHLPEQQTDFIFAILAEEAGLVGVVFLIGLFTLLLQSGWRVVRRCPDPALRIVALGITLNIVLQAFINIAVATASAPTKGIPLPFVSHGSTGLTMFLLQAGIVIGIARHSSRPDPVRAERS